MNPLKRLKHLERFKRMERFLKIGPRYVKQNASGLCPFQREALKRLKRFKPFKLVMPFNARLIFVCPESLDDARDKLRRRVEAPVRLENKRKRRYAHNCCFMTKWRENEQCTNQ